jgi:hypothetical protein
MSIVTIPNASTPPVGFTPGLTFGGAAVGLTFASRSGIYIPISKNLLWFKLDILLSAKGSSVGGVAVTGLPLVCAGDGNCSVSIGYASALSSVAGHLGAIVNSGSASIELTQTGTGTIADLNNTNFTNSSRIMISGLYNV